MFPGDVLAQLGSRVQHQLRAHTPDDARALKATVSTYPNSGYDLGDVLTTLATGEAIVTVMNEDGAPTPVAWTRLRAPQGSMSPTPAERILATVDASPLRALYGTPADSDSAQDLLSARARAAGSGDQRRPSGRVAELPGSPRIRVAREAPERPRTTSEPGADARRKATPSRG